MVGTFVQYMHSTYLRASMATAAVTSMRDTALPATTHVVSEPSRTKKQKPM